MANKKPTSKTKPKLRDLEGKGPKGGMIKLDIIDRIQPPSTGGLIQTGNNLD